MLSSQVLMTMQRSSLLHRLLQTLLALPHSLNRDMVFDQVCGLRCLCTIYKFTQPKGPTRVCEPTWSKLGVYSRGA